jgi:hypothetical protein
LQQRGDLAVARISPEPVTRPPGLACAVSRRTSAYVTVEEYHGALCRRQSARGRGVCAVLRHISLSNQARRLMRPPGSRGGRLPRARKSLDARMRSRVSSNTARRRLHSQTPSATRRGLRERCDGQRNLSFPEVAGDMTRPCECQRTVLCRSRAMASTGHTRSRYMSAKVRWRALACACSTCNPETGILTGARRR